MSSNGYWVSKDGLRIPKRDSSQRKQWDASYLARLKDYFGDDSDYEPALLPVADIESNHAVFESAPRTPFYSRLYRQNVVEVPPVLVTQDSSGRYQMRDGNHRLAAAQRAGVSHIPALIQRPKQTKKPRSSSPHVFTGTKVHKLGAKPMKKSEGYVDILDLSKHDRDAPPQLPKRIARAMWALHQPGVLTDELRKPEYRSDPNPLAGHCFVATNALFHLIDGPKTGWDMKCLSKEHVPGSADTHWFLQHRKTGHILDPTIDQFEGEPVPYEKAVGRGTSQTGDDVGKPTKRAQVVIDRAKGLMSEQPKEYLGTLEHDGQDWYIQPPEMKKAEGKRISLDDANGLYDWFHISSQEPDESGQFRVTLRIPKTAMTGEETKTPRICVGPSIHHCVAGLLGFGGLWHSNQDPDPEYPGHILADLVKEDPGAIHQFRGMHVYGTRRPRGLIEPSPEQVPDAPMTGEHWLTKPNVLEHVGQLTSVQRGSTIPSFKSHLTKAERDPLAPPPALSEIRPGLGTVAKWPRPSGGGFHQAALTSDGWRRVEMLEPYREQDFGRLAEPIEPPPTAQVRRESNVVQGQPLWHPFDLHMLPEGAVLTHGNYPEQHIYKQGGDWFINGTKVPYEAFANGMSRRGGPSYTWAPSPLAKAEPKPKLSVGLPAYRSPDGRNEEWDYSHLLPQKTRDEGYRIKLRTFRSEDPLAWKGTANEGLYKRNRLHVFATKTQDGRSRPAGQLVGGWEKKTLQPWESVVSEQDRRKRLGLSMYEAMYAHGRAQLGATSVAGESHSTSAHLVHKKLALKHGLNYEAKPNIGFNGAYDSADEWRDTPAHDSDAKYGEYKYKLPDVLKPKQVNSFAEHKLPGSLPAEGYRLNVAHSPDTTIGTIHRNGEVLGHIELTPKGHAFEEWTGNGERTGLRDAVLSVLRGHMGGEAGHDEWNNVSKLSKPLARSESGNLQKYEDLRTLSGIEAGVGVRSQSHLAQGPGVPALALQGLRDDGVGGVPRAQPPEGRGSPGAQQPRAESERGGVSPHSQGGNQGQARRLEAPVEGADGRAQVGPVHGLRGHVPSVRDGLGPHGLLAKSGERGQHGGPSSQLEGDTGGSGEVRTGVLELPPGQDSHPTPHGSHVTKPHLTYTHGAAAKPFGTEYEGGKNVWARNCSEESNKGRTLMVQFSTHLLQGGRKPDEADAYYDKLYSTREGYHRGADFWEVPAWSAHMTHSLPATDHYTVRDPEEAIKFMGAAGYDHVAFSALDVNKDFVRRLAQGTPGQHVVVGGYTDMNHFGDLKNVSVHPSIKSFVESEGHTYQPGYDYRHFTGMKTIPRLTLSDGCRHNCTFCCVPKQVDEKTREEILQQADSFAEHLPSDLIYLNDKTFGQAKNHAMLPEIYQRIRAKNPAFKGFIIQTTAAQMKRFTPEYLKAAGIRHVELGVESVNDPILKAHKKPATEAIIEEAANKVRAAGASLIPNIMVGLPGEDRETYARTLGWLQKHRDIISHVNTYNLALYDDSELGKKLQVINAGDRDENVQQKSWHTDPQTHADFAKALFGFANGQLDQPIGHAQAMSKAEPPEHMWHLTGKKDFAIDPSHQPVDAYGLGTPTSKPGLFLSNDPSYWAPYVSGQKDLYAVRVKHSGKLRPGHGHHPEWFDENPASAQVVESLPIKDALAKYPADFRGGSPLEWSQYEKRGAFNERRGDYDYEQGARPGLEDAHKEYRALIDRIDARNAKYHPLGKADKPFMKSPAFRHASSGKVIATPVLHDRDVLASKLKLPADHESLYNDWEAGFIDHSGNFYDREAAQAAVTKWGAVPHPKASYLEDISGLESEQYTAGREAGVFKSEPKEFKKRVLDPRAGYTIQHHQWPGDSITVTAHTRDGEKVGVAEIDDMGESLQSGNTEVDWQHRRKGVASAMYAHAENILGKPMRPSSLQSEMAANLWFGNRNADNRQFGRVRKAEGQFVYRVEDKKGAGPYAASSGDDAPSAPGGPLPEEDFEPSALADRSLVYGFSHPDHAKQWFGEGLNSLRDRGFSVVQYPAKRVVESKSGSQVLFERGGKPTSLASAPRANVSKEVTRLAARFRSRATSGELQGALASGDLPQNERAAAEMVLAERKLGKAEVDHHDPVSCVVMVQDGLGRTLWGKRKDGKYTMPAGHADAHEHPADCAKRELMEEAGLKAEALWLIGSGNGGEGPVHVYHAIAHGQPRIDLDPDREMASWEWQDCLRGPPPHITANLAHNPDAVYSLFGWEQPLAKMARAPKPPTGLRAPVQEESPEFKKWFGGSQAVDKTGKPKRVLHGTTHDFQTFSEQGGHPEGFLGRAHYFTDSPTDANSNYAAPFGGPDLQGRVQDLAERLEDDPESWNPEEGASWDVAEKQLVGTSRNVMPVYLRMKNPLVIKEGGGHVYDDHKVQRLYAAIQKVTPQYEKLGGPKAKDVWNFLNEGYGQGTDNPEQWGVEGRTAFRVDENLRELQGAFNSPMNDDGFSVGNEYIRDLYRAMGHDGVILDASRFRGMHGTKKAQHYIVFRPQQVKSAIGNRGTFSHRHADITKDEPSDKPAAPQEPVKAPDGSSEGEGP